MHPQEYRKYSKSANKQNYFLAFHFQWIYFFLFTFPGILTPNDEFQFWTEQTHRGNKQISKERASYFKELFETISRVCNSYILYVRLLIKVL